MYVTCVQCPRRPEKGVVTFETRGRGSCESWCKGWESKWCPHFPMVYCMRILLLFLIFQVLLFGLNSISSSRDKRFLPLEFSLEFG